MALILLLLGIALGVRLGVRHALKEASPEIREEYQRIDRQEEYWDCLQCMLAEAVAWGNERDQADWWKHGEPAPY